LQPAGQHGIDGYPVALELEPEELTAPIESLQALAHERSKLGGWRLSRVPWNLS
jgi:hypothetical protein